MASMTHSARPDFPAGAVAGPLSIRDLSALLERLPASERAGFAWAPAVLEQEILPLLEGPLTTDAVVACTTRVFGVLGKLIPSLMKLLGTERFLAEVDGAYAGALDRLRASLPDSGSKRSADWVVRALQGFTRVVSQAPRDELAAMDAHSMADPGFVAFLREDAAGILRAAVLLMAAMSISDQGGDPERAAELCDLAFLNAAHAVDRLASVGFAIAPDPRVTPSDRGREILATVEEARAALATEDIDTISRARLRDLR